MYIYIYIYIYISQSRPQNSAPSLRTTRSKITDKIDDIITT